MFRLQEMVPEAYADQSRDFQLFCRLYDVIFNSVKFNIDSLTRSSAKTCDASLLDLLKYKLGFTQDLRISDNDLRYILDAFPHIVKYKGSKTAVDYVLRLYSRIAALDPDNIQSRTLDNMYLIEIVSESLLPKLDVLIALLKEIVPAGYTVSHHIVGIVYPVTNLVTQSNISYYVAPDIDPNKLEKRLTRIVLSKDELGSYENISNELPVIINVAQVTDVTSNVSGALPIEIPYQSSTDNKEESNG